VHYFAVSHSAPKEAIERALVDLVHAGVVRVDRDTGTLRKRYSLVGSVENRLIDGFVRELSEPIVSDERHIRRREHELDARITTASGAVYVVEAMLAHDQISPHRLASGAHRLAQAKSALGLTTATGVLVIGTRPGSDPPRVDISRLETEGVRVTFVPV